MKQYELIGTDGRPYPSPAKGLWGGHRGNKIYGLMECPAATRAIALGSYVKSRVFFADESTAIAAGYRPCGVCLREKYLIWKHERREGGIYCALPPDRRADNSSCRIG